MPNLVLQRWWQLPGGAAFAIHQTSNGQYAWIGNENGAFLYNRSGKELFAHPGRHVELPVIGISARADFSKVFFCAREGDIRSLELEARDDGEWIEKSTPRRLYRTGAPDLNSLAYAEKAGLLAIGHLCAGLAVYDELGDRLLWSQHPDKGTATDADSWLVSMDAEGKLLVVGSAMHSANFLAALEPATGLVLAPRLYLEGRTKVTALCALPSGKGVLVALANRDPYSYSDVGRLVLYNHDFSQLIWEISFDEAVTALAVDPVQPLCVVSEGFNGKLHMISIESGHVVAPVLILNTLANQVSLTQGRYLAAATQDGHLAFLSYQP